MWGCHWLHTPQNEVQVPNEHCKYCPRFSLLKEEFTTALSKQDIADPNCNLIKRPMGHITYLSSHS